MALSVFDLFSVGIGPSSSHTVGPMPETVDTSTVVARAQAVRETGRVRLLGTHEVALADDDLVLHRRQTLRFHPNGMRYFAYAVGDVLLRERTFYSVGGGFVVDEAAAGADRIAPDSTAVTYPFLTGDSLLERCAETGLPVSGVMLANELSWRSEAEVRRRLLDIWAVMTQCVANGCANEGVLPGGLKVPRRAPEL